MKLHEIPRNTWIEVLEEIHVPPGAPQIGQGDIIFFRHLDGMYSLCTLTDSNEINYDEALHLVAWTQVIPTTKPQDDEGNN